jgi:hypothetical protein
MARLKETDEGMEVLYAALPEGWAMGPLRCPIGLDSNRNLCSAGYCIGCQLDRHEWEMAHVDIKSQKETNP